MRRSILLPLFLLLVIAAPAWAQPAGPSARPTPAGSWAGSLFAAGTMVPVVLRVAPAGSGYHALLDVPSQGLFDHPARVNIHGDAVEVEIAALHARFRGTQSGSVLEGTWAQGDVRVPLFLRRTSHDAVRRRPQEPAGALPYVSRPVSFTSAPDDLRLAGTLAVPAGPGPHPAVVLIAGSGPHDRDAAAFGHRPFLVLADHLARQGIAVLRFDERGVGESDGDFSRATTADHADDVAAAVTFLARQHDIDPARIGLVGHSEGGVIAPMVASVRDDVAFIVLLAAPGIALRDIALRQAADISRSEGMSEAWIARHVASLERVFDLVGQQLDAPAFVAQARPLLERAHARSRLPADVTARRVDAALATYLLPWTQFAFRYDPAPALSQVRVPVLALNGTLDVQVCSATNLSAIAATLRDAGNTHVVTRQLPGLNHYLQTARTGALGEYGTIEETIAPIALHEVSGWIRSRVPPALSSTASR